MRSGPDMLLMACGQQDDRRSETQSMLKKASGNRALRPLHFRGSKGHRHGFAFQVSLQAFGA